MQQRVLVVDGDVGEIYSTGNGENFWGFKTCDDDCTVLIADAFIVAAKEGWEILGMDPVTGDLMVRRYECYSGDPHHAVPCNPQATVV
jgi:hypothetical protein